MKHLRFTKIAFGIVLLFAALPQRALRADSWDRRTIISFSDAVQVPGTTLPAGKYVFKLWDSPSDRYVVQIFNERQNHVFATLMTIPEYRLNPPDKSVIDFYEAPAGQPQPIRAWFYPGDNNGREFVYSKAEADVIARGSRQDVPTEQTAFVTRDTTPAAPQPAVAPEPAQTDETAEEAAAPAPAPVAVEPEPTQESPRVDDDAEDQQPAPPPAAQDPPTDSSSSMPATGSELPLAGLIGLSSIGAAISVRAIRHARRSEVG